MTGTTVGGPDSLDPPGAPGGDGPTWRRPCFLEGVTVRGRRGSQQQRAAAEAARDAAGQEFYRMDSAQRAARIAVAAFARIEPGPAAALFGEELAPVDGDAELVSVKYIATLDGIDIDAMETGVELEFATKAFEATIEDLRRSASALEMFVSRRSDAFERADRALVECSRRVAEVSAAVGQARAAVSALGADAGDTADLLTAAEQAAARLSGGAPELGVPETLRRADAALRAAEEARLAASTAGVRTTALRRRLGSLRVRSDGLRHRASLLDPDLSLLRRHHVESSWHDVGAALVAARPLLTSVPERIRNAEGLLDAGRRERAAQLVRAVVEDLELAEQAVDAVGERRRALDALAADPLGALTRTRFVLRDAQRLAVSGPEQPRTQWVTRLDALAARLDGLAAAIGESSRRDWWAFAAELGVVERAAAAVVEDIRRARGGATRR